MTAPRPEAVTIVDAIFDEIDLHAHNEPPCEADCLCCAEIRKDWTERIDAALTAAREEQREMDARVCDEVEAELNKAIFATTGQAAAVGGGLATIKCIRDRIREAR